MFSKTSALLIIILAAFWGVEFSKIYVTDHFEKPFMFRLESLVLKLAGNLAKLAAYFECGNEASNLRYALNYLNELVRCDVDNVQITKKKIENVSVSIYTVRSSHDKVNLPVMIYLHGGFYVFGSSDGYNLYLSEVAKRLNLIVISVDYRLAPEFPYPNSINDCYRVTDYILSNPNEFKADPNAIILAGDSAGGNALAVVTQKLLLNNKKLPHLQILIYPRTQLINFRLPSYIKYANTGFVASLGINPRKFNAWYLGIKNVTKEIEEVLSSNAHTALVDTIELQNKIANSLDVNQIPNEYKSGKMYYDSYETQKKYYYSFSNEVSILSKLDEETISLMKNAFHRDVSPILADVNELRGLPKAYFIVCEWDTNKDETLIYAEKLKLAGVNVTVKFYEDAFHGIVSLIDTQKGFAVARQMLNDMVDFVKNNL